MINKLFRLGIDENTHPSDERRFVLLNKIIVYFLLIGAPLSLSLYFIDEIPRSITYYITALFLVYVLLLYLNHKKLFVVTGLYIVIAGDLATASAPVLLGLESQAQNLLLVIAGVPYLVFPRSWGVKRLLLAGMAIPIWVGLHFYCSSHAPIIALEPNVLEGVGYFYSVLLVVWSTYIVYHFTLQTEKFADRIKGQRDLLDEKNKQLEQFNYMATHDLKTPIANIEGFHTLLGMDLENPEEEVRQSMHGISLSINQAKKTIRDLIEVTRFSNLIEEVNGVELQELMTGIEESMSLMIEEHRVTIHADFKELPQISFGPIALRSILQNLVSNAIKYHSPKRSPEIWIRSFIEKEFAVISVRDNGLGIDLKTQKDALFAMFKRIHSKAEGTGMGLFMIKNLIEERGGNIDVESQVDEGTTFIVRLPLLIIS